MGPDESTINVNISANLEKKELTRDDFSFFADFDIITVRILQKFYGGGFVQNDGPLNTFYVQQLHLVLNKEGLKIGMEGLRKKLEFLVRIGFLEKVKTYPRIYMPIRYVEGIKKIQFRIEQLKKIFL